MEIKATFSDITKPGTKREKKVISYDSSNSQFINNSLQIKGKKVAKD